MGVQHWLTRYTTGVASIDKLHDELFDGLDKVYTDIINRAGNARILQQIDVLADKLIAHLDEEEQEMQQAGYDALEAHTVSHRALRTQIAALKKRATAGGAIGTDVLDAFNQYFTSHIKQFDLPWAKALNARS